jgi:hippurate hydrolase
LVANRIFGPENVLRKAKPMLAGEDFAYMLERVPGAYLLFGQRDSGPHQVPLHNPNYDFNDDLLPAGSRFFVELVEQELV